MVKYINEVTRDFGIEHHTLRNWEDKGYLGTVERDFTHGRMYDEEQIERIKTIQKVVQDQQTKGMKRTDFKEVERVLLEKFGGLVETRPQSIPATPEVFTNLVLKLENQDKQIKILQQMMMELSKKELPNPKDYSKDLQELTLQQEKLIQELENERKEREKQEEENKLFKEKLDIAVDYIQKQEQKENEQKKSVWKRLFG